ncbi:MAG: hypothetical protein NZM30_13190, partial [Geminocystis sp.]|nr:hypothetical protein [Geminocystis sp.]
MSKVDLMAEDKGYVVYGAKLLELLLSFPIQNNDDKLWKLHRIFRYYIRACRHEDAKRIALKYEKHSKTRGEKLLASQMLVYNQIHGGDWLSISPYVERYKQRLKEFIEEDEPLEKDYLKTWLIATVDSLYWLQDKPRENRFLINGIAKRFELENRSRFSYPVYFYKPKNRQKKLKIGYIGHTLRSHSVGLL